MEEAFSNRNLLRRPDMDIEHYYIEKGFGDPLILLGDRRDKRRGSGSAHAPDRGDDSGQSACIHSGELLYCK